MKKYTDSVSKYTTRGVMKNDEGITLKEAVKLYYGEVSLSEEEEKEVDEMLREIEESGFLEKCKEVARQKQKERDKKFVHIGHWCISKVACLIIAVIIVGVLGGTAYAAVRSHIREIEVEEMGDHSEVKVGYNYENEDGSSVIETFYKPVWIPDGYQIQSEIENNIKYTITYVNDESGDILIYDQYTPSLRMHYGAENSIHENVSFGKYWGEYIVDESDRYLVVTDGTYLYDVISENITKETMIKMLVR